MTGAYYNENDPAAAAWLRELIKAGHIAKGEVDDRSIHDVQADDLRGFTQCHFFAGVGVWSYALRLGGWPDDRPVWTGSCPCQPFSVAGKRLGASDPRNLWPVWLPLIREHRPATILGEQVAQAAGYRWWDTVSADLERENYACGAADLAAASVGAPHIRQRLYWLANAQKGRHESRFNGAIHERHAGRPVVAEKLLPPSGLANATDSGRQRGRTGQAGNAGSAARLEPKRFCDAGGLANGDGPRLEVEREQQARRERAATERGGEAVRMGHAHSSNSPQGAASCGGHINQGNGPEYASGVVRPGPLAGQWSGSDWLGCTDGKWRPVEPGAFPLAHGIAGRMGLLRGYGNAICAPLAASFVESVIDCL